jgi:polyisoprenoid-binding protein YceI
MRSLALVAALATTMTLGGCKCGGGSDAAADKGKVAAPTGNLEFDSGSSRATFEVGLAKGSFCRAQGEMVWERSSDVPTRFRFLIDDPRPSVTPAGAPANVDAKSTIRLLGSSVTFEATKVTKTAEGKFDAEGSLSMGELRVPVKASLIADLEAGGVVRSVHFSAGAVMDREGGSGRIDVQIRIEASPKGKSTVGQKPPECGV